MPIWGVSLVWTILREWETVVDILQLGASWLGDSPRQGYAYKIAILLEKPLIMVDDYW